MACQLTAGLLVRWPSSTLKHLSGQKSLLVCRLLMTVRLLKGQWSASTRRPTGGRCVPPCGWDAANTSWMKDGIFGKKPVIFSTFWPFSRFRDFRCTIAVCLFQIYERLKNCKKYFIGIWTSGADSGRVSVEMTIA